MASSKKKRSGRKREEIICVPMEEIFVSASTRRKLMSSDYGQIAEMRFAYESGQEMVRVILKPRAGGGYDIEDGRHRVIAAELAGIGYLDALIVGT